MISRYRDLPAFYRYTIELIVMIAVFFAIQAWMGREMSEGDLPVVDAMDIRESKSIHLPIDSNQPYIVHFWATWCPVCRWMESSIISISQDYPVIGIALQSGSNQEILEFMQKHKIHYPTISDADGTISKTFGVNAVPGTFVVDRSNKIRFRERGLSSEWGLRFRLWWSSISTR